MNVIFLAESFNITQFVSGSTHRAGHTLDLVLSLGLSVSLFLCGSVVEHCVSSAKDCGFDSQGTHILMKMYNLNAIVSRFG